MAVQTVEAFKTSDDTIFTDQAAAIKYEADWQLERDLSDLIAHSDPGHMDEEDLIPWVKENRAKLVDLLLPGGGQKQSALMAAAAAAREWWATKRDKERTKTENQILTMLERALEAYNK